MIVNESIWLLCDLISGSNIFHHKSHSLLIYVNVESNVLIVRDVTILVISLTDTTDY